MSFYCYIPIKSKFTTIENTIEFIEKNLLCKVIKNDYECFSTLTNYQIEFSNETVWINTITNTDFASDTRDFIRFRLSTSCNRLIEHLKKITKDLNGYYGMSSKIFLDSDNKKVYDVKDGENYILLSGGEIVREIETAEPKYTFEYLRELNAKDLIKKYMEVFSIKITKSEQVQSNFNFPISTQKYKETYYINQ